MMGERRLQDAPRNAAEGSDVLSSARRIPPPDTIPHHVRLGANIFLCLVYTLTKGKVSESRV
jgi:hypothetical protein